MIRKRLFMMAAAAAVVQFAVMGSARAELIGYWPLDEITDNGENMITEDASPGGGHHGVVLGDAEIIADSVRGNVLNLGDFNNGAGVDLPTFPQDERADAGVDDSLGAGFNAIVESQEATISFWLNRNGEAATNQWTFLFQDGGNRQLGSHAPWSNGQVYFDVSGCCGGNQRINTSMNGADTDGEWHHLAFVKKVNREETDKAVSVIFQDGVALVSSPGCDLDCWNAGATDIDWGAATIDDVVPITTAAFGSAPGGGNSNNGLIDDFAVWDEALTVERIVGIANGGGVIPFPEGVLPGDFNDDNVIDAADFEILATNFNAGPFSLEEAYFKGDLNGSLNVDLKDFLNFRERFEFPDRFDDGPEAAAAAAIPEPSTGLLMCLAGLSLLGLRKRS